MYRVDEEMFGDVANGFHVDPFSEPWPEKQSFATSTYLLIRKTLHSATFCQVVVS